MSLGACPRIDDLLRKRECRPDFTLEFVKYGRLRLIQSSVKSDSAPRPLAKASILVNLGTLYLFVLLFLHASLSPDSSETGR